MATSDPKITVITVEQGKELVAQENLAPITKVRLNEHFEPDEISELIRLKREEAEKQEEQS
jgi:hypothetical protein